MDWDPEPTPFFDFVTIEPGNASNLLFDSDNGFETADPLGPRRNRGFTGRFVDVGPGDRGALFDFGFGALAAGGKKTFKIFYGAAASEAEAVDAVNGVGAEVFSFGQPSTPDGPTLGTPNTFIFAFGNVGGTPVFSPDAVNDSLTTPMNTPAGVNVLANDTDPNGDALTVTGNTQSANGTVGCTAAGVCTYSPTAGFSGSDSFDYSISDGHGGSDTASVAVTVRATNSPPVASDGSVETDEGAPVEVTLKATDADGDVLSFVVVAGPGHGSLGAVSGSKVTYTPAAGFAGPDSFTFKANDGKADSNTATVSITVKASNQAPVASDGSAQTDAGVPVEVTLSAADADGDALTFAVVAGPGHGSLGAVSGSKVTYMPAAGYVGPDSFSFKANDGTADSNVATVSIMVRALNHAPVAEGDSVETDEDTPVAVTLKASDVDGDVLTYALVSNPSHGTLSGSGANRTYTPDPGFYGGDVVGFTANDGSLDSNFATISITVRSVNDPPVAKDDSASTDQNTALVLPVGALLANDSDPDGDQLSVTGVSGTSSTHGTVSLDAGDVTYTPSTGYTGPASFEYRISDVNGGSATASVNVTVKPVGTPLECRTVRADPGRLWPPNHKFELVEVSGCTDGKGKHLSVTITGVTQDEPVNGLGDGDTSPDAKPGKRPNEVWLRAERAGGGDGRVYRIAFTASDGKGHTCSGKTLVRVPHDQKHMAVDSGFDYDSFATS
jgi:hypothetical protein